MAIAKSHRLRKTILESSLNLKHVFAFVLSSRHETEPAQVFTLLETIYNAFDLVAKRRRIFKVEVSQPIVLLLQL